MKTRRIAGHGYGLGLMLGALLVALPLASRAEDAAAPASEAATAPEKKLFAVEIKIGPQWVAGKAPGEQAYFREHSANLRALREQGSLLLGARYGDKGLVVLAADSEAAARAMIDQDPAVTHGTFSYELFEFSVFYGGSVQPPPRKP